LADIEMILRPPCGDVVMWEPKYERWIDSIVKW